MEGRRRDTERGQCMRGEDRAREGVVKVAVNEGKHDGRHADEG